jgi:hypothetical protein
MRSNAAAPQAAAGEGPMRKFVIIVPLLAAVAVILFQWAFPIASYRYRLTVSVEVDGQVHSGSSVIEVWHRFNPRTLWHAVGVYNDGIRGQAVLVGLGSRGILVAALAGQDRGCTVDARYLVGRAYEPASDRKPCVIGYPATIENERALAQRHGSIELTPDNLPAFIWFSDDANLNTAKMLEPADFAAVIGDSARLVSAQIEITNDPVVIDLDTKLPLYRGLPPPPPLDSIKLPNGVSLNWEMFISRE